MRMTHSVVAVAAMTGLIVLTGCSSDDDATGAGPPGFFVTSMNPGKGGNLGGLAGADAWCQNLAEDAGLDRDWHAYLSLSFIDARDHIGSGPWYNVEGVLIARDIEQLHADNNISNKTTLDENGHLPDYLIEVDGQAVRTNEDSLMHDILTGTNEDGTANELTCNGWSDGSPNAQAMLGHADRLGREPGVNSWNAVHASAGCDMDSLIRTGGAGMLYCFAID